MESYFTLHKKMQKINYPPSWDGRWIVPNLWNEPEAHSAAGSAHDGAGQHVSGEMDAADDPDKGDEHTYGQEYPAQRGAYPPEGHVDDKDREHMAAGEGVALGVLGNEGG